MSGSSEQERRVEELLRVNAHLAAEVRALSGEHAEIRTGSVPAARRVLALESERDALATELRGRVAELEGERDALQKHRDELLAEVTRLRSGLFGFLRRAWARLLGA